MKNDTLTSLFI